MSKVLAVVSVSGADQKGVVARFATHMAERGINIEDLEQQVVRGTFIMDMLVDLHDMTCSLDELITDLLTLGSGINMDVRVSLHDQKRVKKIAVVVSKEPHCLEQLIEDQKLGHFRGRGVIDCVLGNHADLKPLADAAGLPFDFSPTSGGTDKAAHMAWLLGQLQRRHVDLVVLARYMQIVDENIVAAFRGKIINIHPSLLPYFPGAKPYTQAWEQGVRVTGCTAHFVTENLDEGPIILQDVFHINVGKDTAEDVKAKGQALEARVLSDAVQMFLDEKLLVVDDKVVFRPGLSTFLDHNI